MRPLWFAIRTTHPRVLWRAIAAAVAAFFKVIADEG